MRIFIPAHIGSKRFPGKAIYPVAGVPLIVRCYELSMQTGISCTVVTPDQEVYDVCKSNGLHVLLHEINCCCGTDRVAFAVSEDKSIGDDEIIVNIQSDNVLFSPITVHSLASVAGCYADGFDSVLSLYEPIEAGSGEASDTNCVKAVLSEQNNALYFSRCAVPFGESRQLKHIGIYVYSKKTLRKIGRRGATHLEMVEGLEQLRWLEMGIEIKMFPHFSKSFAINCVADVENYENRIVQCMQ